MRLLGLLDLAGRHQLGRVGEGAVGLGVKAEIRHGTVKHRCMGDQKRLFHDRLLEGDHRLDGFEAVINMTELQCVGPHDFFVNLQALNSLDIDAVAPHFHVGAVIGQNDFLAGLHADKFVGRAENIVQMVQLVLG